VIDLQLMGSSTIGWRGLLSLLVCVGRLHGVLSHQPSTLIDSTRGMGGHAMAAGRREIIVRVAVNRGAKSRPSIAQAEATTNNGEGVHSAGVLLMFGSPRSDGLSLHGR
jgi:hypothetical protein